MEQQQTEEKIRAISKVNLEIICRVEQIERTVIYEYDAVVDSSLQVQLVETVRERQVSEILAEYSAIPRFRTDIWDVFNDRLDWFGKKSWSDLKYLNHKVSDIVAKFRLLDPNNAEVRLELAKYLENIEMIQEGLGAVEQILCQRSRLEEFQRELGQANSALAHLKREGVRERCLSFFDSSLLDIHQDSQLTAWFGGGWKLQYRASRDGWNAAKFHQLCDGKGPTVTLVSTENSLFGGYLSKSWNSFGSAIIDAQAALFTLVNVHDVPPTKFDLKGTSAESAAFGNVSFGPTFGGGYDLFISTKANENTYSRSSFPYSFVDPTDKANYLFAGTKYFRPTEIEVFVKL